MIRTPFNEGWQAREKVNRFLEMGGIAPAYQDVRLPHDAMIGRRRDPAAGGASGFFPGGVYEYRKSYTPPADLRDQRVLLEFEGVYRDAMVYINGAYAGQCPSGYTAFTVRADSFLRFGEENEIRVECRVHQDSRWYSGAGIHRDVHLVVGGPVRLALDGVRVTTRDADAGSAVVELSAVVENDGLRPVSLDVSVGIQDEEGGQVASGSVPVTVLPGEPATVRQRLYVRDPALWSPERPALHTASVVLVSGDEAVDQDRVVFGIRTLQLDPEHGLRINGESVKLRGACIHHDNGVLGSAAFARAEERRVELLKQAGFNAIRSSHNPLSRVMLDACDRLGMLVMDEAFDMWTVPKSDFDYALSFPTWWEHDIEAMVRKNANHPSVVLYSIGNEIPEAATPHGAVWGRRIAEKVRSLDDTRFVTNGVNIPRAAMMAAVMAAQGRLAGEFDTLGPNAMMVAVSEAIRESAASELVTGPTAESFGVLDVAGMNYMELRYEVDRELFPNRVIVGTETHPTRIDELWRLVLDNSHVIGDFTWTGWDYLGEAGVGRVKYADSESETGQVAGIAGAYPWLTAWVGDIDITGWRRPPSYYRETVFGLRAEPYIAVHRPENHGRRLVAGPWSWPEVVPSWSWDGSDGEPITVEVYSDAEEVELLLDGVPLGRAAAGETNGFRAVFETVYRPGELVAVAYRDGKEHGRSSLVSATGPLGLAVRPDRGQIGADGGDLVFVSIMLTDHQGNARHDVDRPVTVDVEGPAVLQGLGSGRPATEEPYTAPVHTTYEGRVLAVVRATGPGEITLRVSATDCEPVAVVVQAR
ncbi:glycoside hydrolase family 2 TIM barrel-domain containing protein [Kitasatospora viridis]|uniref:Glycosyl hydrolase family 2 n=1 Tax=Kitasatospora viridis TaxID=281105 RepID=A0A561TWG5_9ACTN|nr:glycoside hydrolase family 2 TIM barrel-domain containing protein [Kitasatospora viridis]TWF91450.1 glycosyl hydrolase family 2 [Kitasatospora viridis]